MASTQQLLLGEGAGGAEKNYIEDVFSTYLYTGTGAAQTITNNIDLAGKGGMVWTKSRSNAISNIVVDSVRGGTNALVTNSTAANSADTGYHISSFNSNGYSLQGAGSGDNFSGYTYASWTFRKQPKFFDVVTYTGNGTSGRAISHSLGSAPGMVITKCTSSSSLGWVVWHRGLASTSAWLRLDTTDSVITSPAGYGGTFGADSYTIVNDPYGALNASGSTYVAYIFAHDAGGFGLTGTDNVISCGSFTTDSSGNASVNLGWEPQWVLTKMSTAATQWVINDNMRGMPASQTSQVLYPSLSAAESSSIYYTTQPNATGFTTQNYAGQPNNTVIYIAIRRGPMKVPTDATKVFSSLTQTGAGTTAGQTLTTGFPVDLEISEGRSSNGGAYFVDRLRGGQNYISSNSTAAEVNFTGWTPLISFANNTGITDANYGYTSNQYVAWNFRRAPSFFDEVILNSSTSTYTHNLTVAPELIFVKCRDASGANWVVYSKSLSSPTTKYLNLNTTGAEQLYGTGAWSTSATQFSIATGLWANGSSGIAYLFATCPGVSKVGSFTNTGTTLNIECGFAGSARFVMCKRTSTTGGWFVYDTARGINAGTDPGLALNSTAAEYQITDDIDAYAGGFTFNGANWDSADYIFLAIA